MFTCRYTRGRRISLVQHGSRVLVISLLTVLLVPVAIPTWHLPHLSTVVSCGPVSHQAKAVSPVTSELACTAPQQGVVLGAPSIKCFHPIAFPEILTASTLVDFSLSNRPPPLVL